MIVSSDQREVQRSPDNGAFIGKITAAAFSLLALTLFLFATPAHAACTSPAGSEGDLVHNAETEILTYCDGTQWRAVNNRHAIPTAGLVGHWTMGDGSGTTATDASGNGNDGTLTNMDAATDWVGGVLGNALDFDGTDDYVDVGTPAELELSGVDRASVCAWVYNRITGLNWGTIYSRGDTSYALQHRDDGYWGFTIYDGDWKSALSDSTTIENVWTHICGTYDGTTVQIYVDGVAQTNTDTATSIGDGSADSVRIGSNSGAGGQEFNGQIDDVRIYNRALSAAEVQALYDMGAGNTADPCNPLNNPTPGTVCTDGTVYADQHNNGNPLYAPRCDAGMTWDGSSCTGTRLQLTFNSGNSTGYVSTPGSTWDGEGNTNTLVVTDSDSNTSGIQQHSTASWCAKSGQNGHSDWYLPGHDEFGSTYSGNYTAIGGFLDDGSTRYWSSSQKDSAEYVRVILITGAKTNFTKDQKTIFRCMRQKYINTCDNPVGHAGDIVYDADDDVLKWCGGGSWHNAGPRPGNSGDTGCSSPAGDEGDMFYNVDHATPVYCDGTEWVRMADIPDAPTNGLVGYWSFDEGSGTTAIDHSGNGNNGTLQNMDATNWVAGRVGSHALDFPDNDDFVGLPENADTNITGDYTLSIWVNLNSLTGKQAIVSRKWIFTLFRPSTGSIYLEYKDNSLNIASVKTTNNIMNNTGQWYHIVFTWDERATDASYAFYLDGQLANSGTAALNNDEIESNSDFVLGRHNTRTDESLDGILDDFRYYNRALSANEVRNLYLNGL